MDAIPLKTLYKTAVMSMDHPPMAVYKGALSALGLMTLLSTLFGNILSQSFTYGFIFFFAILSLKRRLKGYETSHTDTMSSTDVFFEAFIRTLLAEWGFFAQLPTIILGAHENLVGSLIGGIMANALYAGVAVIGGRLLKEFPGLKELMPAYLKDDITDKKPKSLKDFIINKLKKVLKKILFKKILRN